MSFAIDGQASGSYTPDDNMSIALYHEALWASAPLSDGQHTLMITQTKAGNAGQIYIDYVMYPTTSNAVQWYYFDDRDPGVVYTPAWRQFGSQQDFQHTSSESSSVGDSFSFQFQGAWSLSYMRNILSDAMDFGSGKGISFYGGLTSSDVGMQASIVLDGGAPVIYNAPPSPPSITNNLIYQSPLLSDGTHTIVVTGKTVQSVWADYFLVTPSTSDGTTPAPGGGGGGGTQGTSTAGSPGTTGTGVATSAGMATGTGGASVPSGSHASVASGARPIVSGTTTGTGSSGLAFPSGLSGSGPSNLTSTSNSSNSSSSDSNSSTPLPALSATKSKPTAAIAAATLGALLLVGLLLAAFLCLRRRRRRRAAGQGVFHLC
jgi:hypothetical protein